MQANKQSSVLPKIPKNELARLKELYSFNLLNTEKEETFDLLTKLLADILSVPISLISLTNANQQWFKSCYGVDMEHNDRHLSFCAYVFDEKNGLLMIPDTLADKRFEDHPLVVQAPFVRFYCGVIVYGPNDLPIGTVCVIDFKPRHFSDIEIQWLQDIVKIIQIQLNKKEKVQLIYDSIRSQLLFNENSGFPNKASCLTRIFKYIDSNQKNVAIFAIRINNATDIFNVTRVDEKKVYEHLKQHLTKIGEIFHLESNLFALIVKLNSTTDQEIKHEVIKYTDFLYKGSFSTELNINYSFSFGVSLLTVDMQDAKPSTLLEQAIFSLAMLSREERGAVNIYSSDFQDSIEKNFEIEFYLSQAIHKQELYLLYQPLVDARNPHIMLGCEVLLRWQSKELGNISPDIFIPLAEKNGYIEKIDEWVLSQACQQRAIWQKKSFKIPLSVNISARHLAADDFLSKVKNVLDTYKLTSNWLTIELTEHSIIDTQLVSKQLQKLLDIGVNVSLDDFGTGYCSLSTIQTLPCTAIKIDKSYIYNIKKIKSKAAAVKMIINMAHEMKLKVVAEGVETKDQEKFLIENQCDILQGFRFSKPISAKELEDNFIKKSQ
jgi:EAL domain-containing protein (putative c-di-GMP-specific phosphodiesterase class I)